jgi:hypothetical protein
LALANRYADFRGCQAFEIREHDLFDTDIDRDGHVLVTHKRRDKDGNPSHGGPDGSLRGLIVGGFAYVRRAGHVDTQFLAYASQYDKREHTWASHPTAMMMKVAEAMALRKAYPLSGLYSEFEVPPDREPTSLTEPGAAIPIDFGEDEELARQLEDAFHHLGYTRAKVRTIMRGCTTRDERVKVLADLNAEGEAASEPDVVDAEVVDAGVVDEYGAPVEPVAPPVC